MDIWFFPRNFCKEGSCRFPLDQEGKEALEILFGRKKYETDGRPSVDLLLIGSQVFFVPV